jgi:MoaA/NifB/PqqE/SkfB family radical SAM enzyme
MFTNITAVTFKIAQYCNLDCEYCFQKYDTKTIDNKFDKYDDMINLLSKLPLDEDLEFKVTGGEPSLFCDDIRYAYKKLSKLERMKDIKINFTTISNGTNMEGLIELMDEGVLRSWGCKYSWDGIFSSSNSRKPKNKKYDNLFFNNKLSIIGRSRYKDDILIRIALTPNTVDTLYDSFKYALDNGCNKLEYYYLTDCEEYRDLKFIEKATAQLEKIATLKLEYNFTYSNWDALYFTEYCLDKEKDRLRSIACRHLGRSLYIEMDGKIAPCGFFSKDAVFNGCELYMGSIEEGFYRDKVKSFIDQYKEVPMCYNTQCSSLHCFECPATNLFRTGNMQNKLYQTCVLRNIEREIFLEYNKADVVDIEKVKRVYHYNEDWNVENSMPELPYK